ncbi:N-acetyl-gamma-glutamyl-phosphate reductase [Pseudobacteriovorax antillogorgiicola]|uniref:N-acetyl-gamma-glutamyl-phosphate reductase n=1 Tax=Pseudobacteriovorax antillogorgiicola TaxID=1513793 RepID=A0A1Y6C9L5_9BACT|nr:N-acetyl-gamma-glutamyl-phosphate reductase [Pseudobacteriovorax antillogorgiicola]TCS51688.1 N-acetyl-gamma-glutamyl-phosphate reductase [Pseudobacteriovorax antillogorgiicola]SMF49094.1 N-acetyl-gamma-glutamyl-phosphate reductase [Pseudobacteriovorax antillogorgiicola]
MLKVGVIGAAGYTGGEMLHLLCQHPQVQIVFAQSQSQTGAISKVHRNLAPYLNKDFVKQGSLTDIDLVFVCAGHGQGKAFMSEHQIPSTLQVIDLSHDFRLQGGHNFQYGLPEAFRESVSKAQRIANPGCFATAIQLALLPLAAHKSLSSSPTITAITGSTGAGQKPSPTSHFSWRQNNVSVYKSFQHQHLTEIEQTLQIAQGDTCPPIHFVPVRGPFTRGILASVTLTSDISQSELSEVFHSYYEPHPFVHVVDDEPDLKQVVNTNFCFLSIRKHGDQIHIVSVIDNLIKGASGQAIQNMNLMNGFNEMSGLTLKPSTH